MMQVMQRSLMPPVREMYNAVIRRDSQYEGVFILAVKTTGVFCRPTCPARNPKPENVEYFAAAREALLAGYRPCKRCRPLEASDAPPEWLRGLLAEIEADPTRRFRDADLRERGLEPARVSRWFQKHHNMTFHGYQRVRKLGAALGQIQQGADLTDTAYAAGYESASGFRDAFHKLFGDPPGRSRETKARIVVNRVPTPLGPMIAAASETHLVLLEFVDRRMLATQIKRVQKLFDAHFVPGDSDILARTAEQITQYFAKTRREFDLPIVTPGTEFQQAAWAALHKIPYGEVRSYGEQAQLIERPNAVRAIGRANGDNRIAIVVPCHRVIGADGKLCGYGGQLWRKQALLTLERGLD